MSKLETNQSDFQEQRCCKNQTKQLHNLFMYELLLLDKTDYKTNKLINNF